MAGQLNHYLRSVPVVILCPLTEMACSWIDNQVTGVFMQSFNLVWTVSKTLITKTLRLILWCNTAPEETKYVHVSGNAELKVPNQTRPCRYQLAHVLDQWTSLNGPSQTQNLLTKHVCEVVLMLPNLHNVKVDKTLVPLSFQSYYNTKIGST